jgi:hypothetical protein
MINLTDYENYWESVKNRITEIKSILPVIFNAEMGPKIQSLKDSELPALFFITPSGMTSGQDVDNWEDRSTCVIFLMKHYSPQRKTAYEVIKELQPLIEKIKGMMIKDKASGCNVMDNLDLNSLSTIPEGGLYAMFAGWSLGFDFKS